MKTVYVLYWPSPEVALPHTSYDEAAGAMLCKGPFHIRWSCSMAKLSHRRTAEGYTATEASSSPRRRRRRERRLDVS
jgi:hypothetical protein